MLERLRQWLSKPRGVEATEPARPNLTTEEQRLADKQVNCNKEEPEANPPETGG